MAIKLGNEILGENAFDQIGVSISLSADGQTLAVGNPVSLNTTEFDFERGSYRNEPYVSVYKFTNGEWSQIGDKIYSLNSNGKINLNDNFGYSTSLSADGKTLAVGAFYGEVLGASDSAYEGSHAGYVKIYQNIDNNFTQIGDVLSGIAGVLTGLVSVSILSTVVFGSGWLGTDVIANIGSLVGSFLNGGVTGLLVLLILLMLWDNK